LEIVVRYCSGRKSADTHFPIIDARKTLAWINARAGTNVQGHGLRATFASIAEKLVSGGALKRMLNHATGGDVTLGHYVGKSEAQLRAAWQTVADFIDAAAAKAAQPTPAPSVRTSLVAQRRGISPAPARRRRPLHKSGPAGECVGVGASARLTDHVINVMIV
jgi:hypothetical protein